MSDERKAAPHVGLLLAALLAWVMVGVALALSSCTPPVGTREERARRAAEADREDEWRDLWMDAQCIHLGGEPASMGLDGNGMRMRACARDGVAIPIPTRAPASWMMDVRGPIRNSNSGVMP